MINRTSLSLLTLFSVTAVGHHANIEHDTNVIEELEGRIVDVTWRNPHVEMTLAVTNAHGEQVTWHLEAQDVNSLSRRGLGPELIPEGAMVRVAGHPSRTRPSLYVTNMLLPGGTEIKTRANFPPRWSDEHIGFDNDPLFADAPEADASEAEGLFRVWLRIPGANTPFPRDMPLTAAAREASAGWTAEDDPGLRCITGGMPAVMGRLSAPHPMDLVENDGDILVRVEVFDVVRTVHMDANTDPSSQPLSRLGYSVGRWEGDTLVVHTSRVDWQYFDGRGQYPLSQSVDIMERFTLSDDETRLTYELEVTDPETFTETVSASWEFEWRPDLVVEPFGCVAEG